MILVSNPKIRFAFTGIFENSLSTQFLPGEAYRRVKGGYSTIDNMKQQLYPVAGSAVPGIQKSPAYIRGFQEITANKQSKLISCKWIDIIEKLRMECPEGTNYEINNSIFADHELREDFWRDWTGLARDNILGPLGIADFCVVWNLICARNSPDHLERDMGRTGNWHYDNHYPNDYPKIQFYLNDSTEHHSGTLVLDAKTSREITDSSHYMGFSPDRLLELNSIARTDQLANIVEFHPAAGSAMLFWPSRILHAGIFPRDNARYVISMSLMPVPAGTGKQEIAEYQRQLMEDELPSNDPPPMFLPAAKTIQKDHIFLWNGITDDAARKQLFLEVMLGEMAAAVSSPITDQIIAALYHLTSQIELKTPADLVQFCLNFAQTCDPEILAWMENYVKSCNLDIERYHSQTAKDFAFWPDPTHETRPRNLKGLKPFAKRFPILDRKTPISTAGSCFAFEISAVLQEQGYNYLIAERTSTGADGAIVAGQDPNDPNVKFSANYGILFNTPSLYQLAQRAFGVRDLKKILVPDELPEGTFLADPYRENVYFRNVEAYVNDYPRHTAALRKVFTECEIFVFTLGLNECWVYRDDQTAISRNPKGPIYPLVTHKRLTVAENVFYVAEFFKLCRQHNPTMKLILTLSPIPFLATGLSATSHVVEANCHSKSVLRVAAQELTEQFEDIYYFPSFEMVSHTLTDPWEDDLRHVKRSAVKEIVSAFYEMFSK